MKTKLPKGRKNALPIRLALSKLRSTAEQNIDKVRLKDEEGSVSNAVKCTKAWAFENRKKIELTWCTAGGC